jgi:hypothetical protein
MVASAPGLVAVGVTVGTLLAVGAVVGALGEGDALSGVAASPDAQAVRVSVRTSAASALRKPVVCVS